METDIYKFLIIAHLRTYTSSKAQDFCFKYTN